MTRWINLRLDEVCSLITDGTHHSPQNGNSGSFKYVTAKNIRPWGLDITDITYVDAKTHAEIYGRCPVEKEDVLYIKDGVTTGLAVVNTLDEPFSLLSSVALLKPKRDIVEPRFLKYALNSPETFSAMTSNMAGSAIKRLVLRQIRAASIPVPPLTEQKRIADKLDSLIARIEACRDRLDRVSGIIKKFRQSVLAAAVSGKLTEEWRTKEGIGNLDWKSCSVGDLITGIDAGLNVKCDERPPKPNERGLVKISAVTWGTYDDDESKTLPLGAAVRESTKILVGDFLISRANTIELVGACVLVQATKRNIYLSDKVLRLVMPESNKKWLLYWLRSSFGRSQIESLASGNQLSMRNISQANIKAIQVLLPTEDERMEICRRVEKLMDFADRLESRLSATRSKMDALTPAALGKAFRGELVPRDVNDECGCSLQQVRGTVLSSVPHGMDGEVLSLRKCGLAIQEI